VHSFNEVFFDNVRVPKRNMIGEENRGWYVATTTLDFERSGIISAISLEELLKEIAVGTQAVWSRNNATLARMELADRFIEVKIAILLSYRIASMQAAGLIPNMEASITKLFASELSQRIAKTASHLGGLQGALGPNSAYALMDGRIERMYRTQVGSTLAGGTSEIQRNIIAQRGLGLPRE
jgi:alkylation response protein AidB-like acyl-CoA dehydrogenase